MNRYQTVVFFMNCKSSPFEIFPHRTFSFLSIKQPQAIQHARLSQRFGLRGQEFRFCMNSQFFDTLGEIFSVFIFSFFHLPIF